MFVPLVGSLAACEAMDRKASITVCSTARNLEISFAASMFLFLQISISNDFLSEARTLFPALARCFVVKLSELRHESNESKRATKRYDSCTL